MAEAEGIFLADGENIDDVSPYEFDSVVEEVGNTFALDAAAAIHGTKGYKVAFRGAADGAYGNVAIDSRLKAHKRWYMYFPSDSYPHHADPVLRAWYGMYLLSAGADPFAAYIQFASNDSVVQVNRLYYYVNTGMADSGILGDSISTDTSHYLEIYYKIGDGDGAVELLLNGVSIASASALTNDNLTGVIGIRAGVGYASPVPADGDYFYIDDGKIDTSLIGNYCDRRRRLWPMTYMRPYL